MAVNDATPILMDILQSFVSVLGELEPQWQKAYLRVVSSDSSTEVKGSYVHPSGVDIIDVRKCKPFFHSMPDKVEAFLNALEKEEALFLIMVHSNLEYDVKFEFSDMSKWKITKMDGRSGIPEGLD